MKFRFSSKRPHLLISALLLLATVISYVHPLPFFRMMDLKVYDVMLLRSHSKKAGTVPLIVDIDEKSLKKFGQWPWPRYRVALLLEHIRRSGVSAVGLDVIFGEPDRTSPIRIQEDLKRDLNVAVQFSGLPEALSDNDQVMANVLKHGPYVPGFALVGDADMTSDASLHPLNPAVISAPGAKTPFESLVTAQGVDAPLPLFCNAVSATGFITTFPDSDGLHRRTPLLMAKGRDIYPTLGLAVLRRAAGNPTVVLKMDKQGITSFKIGSTVVPVDHAGRMLIHYRGQEGQFPYVSAADFLENKIKPGSLKGRIALVGTTATGLKDTRSIPFDPVFPGVEVHATIIDNILSGDVIHRPGWAPGAECCLIFAMGITAALIISFSGGLVTMLSGVILGGGMWVMSWYLLGAKNIYISPFYPMLLLLANMFVLNFMKYWASDNEKKFFRQAFSKYVSKQVVTEISRSPGSLKLDGEEKDVSILFSDIRGFTTLSEQLSPIQVSDLLKAYFTPMTRVINEHTGTLDKFIGDAIMAFWNAPIDVKNHHQKSVSAAIAMLDHLDILNQSFSNRFGFQFMRQGIDIGIGLHAGPVYVGNMGSEDLFDYTVIGDNVNLASRLEGLTKFYGVRLLLSDVMVPHIPSGYMAQELDLVRVKGRNEPLKIYGIFNQNRPGAEKELLLYNKALDAYRNGHFSEAMDHIDDLIADCRNCRLYNLYADRCASLIRNPPGNWQGIFTHTEK